MTDHDLGQIQQDLEHALVKLKGATNPEFRRELLLVFAFPFLRFLLLSSDIAFVSRISRCALVQLHRESILV